MVGGLRMGIDQASHSTSTSAWSYASVRVPASPVVQADVDRIVAQEQGEESTGTTTPLELEEILTSDRYSRQLQRHEESDRWVVIVTDRRNGRVAYTIPPESLLETIGRIRQFIGILLDTHV